MEHLEVILWVAIMGFLSLDYYQYRQQAKEERAMLDDIHERMTKPRINIPVGKITWNVRCACQGELREFCMIHGPNGNEAYELLPPK